jgi:anti-anti-sigma regulatory factor
MLTVKKGSSKSPLQVSLAGTVDETTDFFSLIGSQKGPIVLDCSRIDRINSVGVKAWMKYFSALRDQKVKFVFEKISPAIVDQLNFLHNFTCGGKISSMLLPFKCTSCKNNFVVSIKIEDALKLANAVPPVKCSQCGASSEFDDIASEYFEFIKGVPESSDG